MDLLGPQAQATVTCYKHDYIGNIEYQNNTLEAYYTEEGRINYAQGSRTEYNIKDHLGNTRVCFTPPATGNAPKILQQTNYYAFGLPIGNLSRTYPLVTGGAFALEDKYQYNGIELNTDFGLLVNEARFRTLDAQLGRWWQIDPEVEQFEAWSPYNSNLDNPIRYDDPEGDCAICPQIGGFIVGAGVDLAFQTYSKYQEGGWDNVGDYNYRSIYISGTTGAVAVTGAEVVVALGVPIGGVIALTGTQSFALGGLESVAKQILATQDDNGNYVSPVDAEVSLPKVAADATISAATGGYGTTAGHMAGEFAGKETGQVLGTTIDATMEGSENMLQIITDSKINANKTQTNTSKAPAPKQPQSLPSRPFRLPQPTQGVY